MKWLLVAAALVLGGCSAVTGKSELVPVVAQPQVAAQDQLRDQGGAPIERIAFEAGVSSATVERLARQHACAGGQGAGRVTARGPVEVYRMQCGDGKVFMARCELRQCREM